MTPKFEPSADYYRLDQISWSGYDLYCRCPQAYRFRYVLKRKPPYNAYNSLGGKAIQKVFELFYNRQLYRRGPETLPTLQELLVKEYERYCRELPIDWDSPEAKLTKEELLEELKPLVPSTLRVIKENRLLGKYARSEVKLSGWVDNVGVFGYVDFIIRRDQDTMILDGKLTKHRAKYLKVDQLTWYMLLFQLHHRITAKRLGWIYYTYGELEWVPLTVKDMKELHGKLRETIALIKKNRFEPTPEPEACRFCDFKKVCPEGRQTQQEAKDQRVLKQQETYEKTGSPLAKPVNGVEEVGF